MDFGDYKLMLAFFYESSIDEFINVQKICAI